MAVVQLSQDRDALAAKLKKVEADLKTSQAAGTGSSTALKKALKDLQAEKAALQELKVRS